MGNRQMLGFAVIGFALLTLLNSVFVVDLRERALVRRLGEITRTEFTPGLHFKIPFVDTVLILDARMLTLDNQTENFLTLEKKNVKVDFFVKWCIADTGTYYERTRGDESVAGALLAASINRGLRDEFASRTIQQALSSARGETTKALAPTVNEIKNGLGIPIRTNGGKTEFFLLKGWVPLADLAKMDVQEAFGMLHPAVKAPIELAMNRAVFTGRPISRFPGQKEKMMGVTVPTTAAHLLRNLVFMQELDRLFFQQSFDPIRTPLGIAGVRTYAQDKVIQMRTRVYDLNGQVGDLKNVIQMATKKYGHDSGITRQAEERLMVVLAERDRVKADLLTIDPTALTTKKPSATPPKPKPLPTTMQGFKRSVDINRLLSAPPPKPKAVVGP